MIMDKLPYSRSIGRSDKYSTYDVPELVAEMAIKSVYVWECSNGHANYTLSREYLALTAPTATLSEQLFIPVP
jgi:hypothetical protein